MSLANRHGSGSLRRAHALVAHADGRVVAGMEDEMHRFELVLHHDGQRVTRVDGRAVRWPWSPCVESPEALREIVGMPLSTRPSAIGRWTDARQQCTHQFDLAGLAVAHAARYVAGGAAARRYDAIVPDWFTPPFDARLWRDGVEMLTWRVGAEAIESPEPFVGVSLRGRFIDWCEENLEHDIAEAAMVLRRAVWISPARRVDLEACATALESHLTPDVCYTAQPQRLSIATRNRGSLHDYGNDPDALLAGFPR